MALGSRSVEELGLELQRVAKRAFPALFGNDLDRLLKGCYFQALDTRWQRKLGAPKPEESFDELFNRERVAERREQQYKEVEGDKKKKVSAPEKQDKKVKEASSKRQVIVVRPMNRVVVERGVASIVTPVMDMAILQNIVGKGPEGVQKLLGGQGGAMPLRI